jgi:hypothetical protein
MWNCCAPEKGKRPPPSGCWSGSRVVHTVETTRRRERVAGQWREKEEQSVWYWAP